MSLPLGVFHLDIDPCVVLSCFSVSSVHLTRGETARCTLNSTTLTSGTHSVSKNSPNHCANKKTPPAYKHKPLKQHAQHKLLPRAFSVPLAPPALMKAMRRAGGSADCLVTSNACVLRGNYKNHAFRGTEKRGNIRFGNKRGHTVLRTQSEWLSSNVIQRHKW